MDIGCQDRLIVCASEAYEYLFLNKKNLNIKVKVRRKNP